MSACRIHLSYYSNPIGFYVKTMSAHGKHLGWRSWSSDTILKVSILLTWKILALPHHFTQSDGFGAPKKVSLHPLFIADKSLKIPKG